MSMNQKQLEKMIGKMMNIIKPNGVSNIKFFLRPLETYKDEYYLSVQYIVPDDSEYLHYSKINILNKWNSEMVKTIRNYFNVDVIIDSSSITSESYHNRLKDN